MAVTLDAQNLYRFFHAGDDEVLALRGFSLSVEAGEMVAIVGPSGSGKSTALACMAGLDEPDGGMVRIAGELMTRRAEPVRAALRARYVGMLFQADNLFGHLTVEGNIAFAQRLGASEPEDAKTLTPAMLLESVGLTGRAKVYPDQLSGGESVRAGLAVAIANNPQLLIADEPTGEIDASNEHRVLELLVARAAAGGAVVVATHSDAVAAAAHRVLRVADGLVVAA